MAQQKMFKFNLLPPKSTAEKHVEQERDNSILNALLLLFVGVGVYLLLLVIQAFALEPQLTSFNSSIATLQGTINQFATTQSLNGELYIKSKSLEPVVAKDIDVDKIFDVADQLVKNNHNVIVESYGREKSGNFVFTLGCKSFEDIHNVITTAESLSGVSDVYVRSSILDSVNHLVITTLSLNINNL